MWLIVIISIFLLLRHCSNETSGGHMSSRRGSSVPPDMYDYEKDNQAWRYSEKMDYLKQRFIMAPPTYDETNFRGYDVEAAFALWLC